MPKYRLLSVEELQHLEKDFVDYLVVNGITADVWEDLKKNELEKAEQIIDSFSDVVFESVLRKAKYLEIKAPNFIYCYQCNAETIVLVAIETPESTEVDFTDINYVAKAMKNPPKSLSIYSQTKKYSKERELEMFQMLQGGCSLSDGTLFKSLSLVLAENKQ